MHSARSLKPLRATLAAALVTAALMTLTGCAGSDDIPRCPTARTTHGVDVVYGEPRPCILYSTGTTVAPHHGQTSHVDHPGAKKAKGATKQGSSTGKRPTAPKAPSVPKPKAPVAPAPKPPAPRIR
ncbi:hypothetical protein ACF082_34285 [Streptomyces lydicus]|uniref:hypothetical protein n=1 Tax=Streptomyces lydicus TaxID=47763 RepID=UPI0036FAFE4A